MQEDCLLHNLYNKLMCDLRELKLPVDEIDVKFREYTKSYLGKYYPKDILKRGNEPFICVYPYKNKKGELMEYEIILTTAIHEMIHHIQYSDPNYRRVSGSMHDAQFWKLYHFYCERAKKIGALDENYTDKSIES